MTGFTHQPWKVDREGIRILTLQVRWKSSETKEMGRGYTALTMVKYPLDDRSYYLLLTQYF